MPEETPLPLDAQALADQLATANTRVAELEPLVDQLATATARIAELEPLADQLATANTRIAELEPLADQLVTANARIAELETAAAQAPEQRAGDGQLCELWVESGGTAKDFEVAMAFGRKVLTTSF